MIAALTLAPSTRGMLAALQSIADVLAAVNEAWIREQLHAGRRPPSSLGAARAPWASERIRYVPSHGEPTGSTRVYQDGPTAMHTARATCIDIAAYDAPASTILLGQPRVVRVLPVGGVRIPLRCHAWLFNPGRPDELIDPLAAFSKEGA